MEGGYEYEAPYLADIETHVILKVKEYSPRISIFKDINPYNTKVFKIRREYVMPWDQFKRINDKFAKSTNG